MVMGLFMVARWVAYAATFSPQNRLIRRLWRTHWEERRVRKKQRKTLTTLQHKLVTRHSPAIPEIGKHLRFQGSIYDVDSSCEVVCLLRGDTLARFHLPKEQALLLKRGQYAVFSGCFIDYEVHNGYDRRTHKEAYLSLYFVDVALG
jgi:hypothetical protein